MNWSGYLNFLKLSINHLVKITIFILILCSLNFAQQNSAGEKSSSIKDTSAYVMQKSPWGAVLRSAIIPGWGQIYNHSYLKVPIIWGIAGWLIYNWSQNNKSYKQYRDLYLQHPDFKPYQDIRNQYKDQRDLFAIYLGLTYLLNMVDAYVDAELFDFSVKPDSRTNSTMLNLRVRF